MTSERETEGTGVAVAAVEDKAAILSQNRKNKTSVEKYLAKLKENVANEENKKLQENKSLSKKVQNALTEFGAENATLVCSLRDVALLKKLVLKSNVKVLDKNRYIKFYQSKYVKVFDSLTAETPNTAITLSQIAKRMGELWAGAEGAEYKLANPLPAGEKTYVPKDTSLMKESYTKELSLLVNASKTSNGGKVLTKEELAALRSQAKDNWAVKKAANGSSKKRKSPEPEPEAEPEPEPEAEAPKEKKTKTKAKAKPKAKAAEPAQAEPTKKKAKKTAETGEAAVEKPKKKRVIKKKEAEAEPVAAVVPEVTEDGGMVGAI